MRLRSLLTFLHLRIIVHTPYDSHDLDAHPFCTACRYIITFDADRPALASVYSPQATFSLQILSHRPTRPTVYHDILKRTGLLSGISEITAALASLPTSFNFNMTDPARPPTVEYDLVIAFDMVVYGTDANDGAPGVMVVCYVDPTGPRSGDEGERWVSEMQFILRRRDHESDYERYVYIRLICMSSAEQVISTVQRMRHWA